MTIREEMEKCVDDEVQFFDNWQKRDHTGLMHVARQSSRRAFIAGLRASNLVGPKEKINDRMAYKMDEDVRNDGFNYALSEHAAKVEEEARNLSK